MRAFGEDPEQYIEARGVDVPCAVDSTKKAKPDKKLTQRMNYEVFMFSSSAARRKFDKDPLKYCGLLTDPVNQRRFHPTPRSPHTAFKGRSYYFASDSTFTVFHATPDSFALRKGM